MKYLTLAMMLFTSVSARAEVLLRNVSVNSVFQLKSELVIPANATATYLSSKSLSIPGIKTKDKTSYYVYCYVLNARKDAAMRIRPETKLKVVRSLIDEVYPASGIDSPFSNFISGNSTIVVDIALMTPSGQRFALECGYLGHDGTSNPWSTMEGTLWTTVATTAALGTSVDFTPGDEVVVD